MTAKLRARLVAAACAIAACCAAGGAQAWTFVVSGDSRNCGDVVMPSIAAGALRSQAAFYWHLGDLRAIYDFDQDFRRLHPDATISQYLDGAWPDFIASQVEPFGELPFFVGIGNHELVPPKTRADFVAQFADWLDAPPIRAQRLHDDPHDHAVRTYYHWQSAGIDFINLDNAGAEQFDNAQLEWLGKRLHEDESGAVRAVVVGMHEALPDSVAHDHSMDQSAQGEASGRRVYRQLLALRAKKPVYVLASHSHFYMGNIYDTPYWRANGGVLKGWIVGTAGAVRYPLPAELHGNTDHRWHTYGYLLATVAPAGTADADPVRFQFAEVTEEQVPPAVVEKFGADFVHACYAGNPPLDGTP